MAKAVRKLSGPSDSTSRRGAEDAEALIKEALGMFLSLRSQRIVIITTPELKDNGALTDAVKKYGVGLYVSEN